ncbi:MAG: hypothetical protein AB8B72_14530 [Crocinitomicaceae bacterium]
MKQLSIFSFSAIVLLILTFPSCNKDSLRGCEEHSKTLCNEDANKTNIRIVNASKYDMCNVVINPSGGESNYGIIEAGMGTCYRTFDLAYSYAYVSLQIGDETFIFQPIDYINEVKLGNGKFTYTLNVLDFNSRTLSIEASEN